MESLARGRKISAIVTTLNRNIYKKETEKQFKDFDLKPKKSLN